MVKQCSTSVDMPHHWACARLACDVACHMLLSWWVMVVSGGGQWQLLVTVVMWQRWVVFDDGGGLWSLWPFVFVGGHCLSLLVVIVGVVAFAVWVMVSCRVC